MNYSDSLRYLNSFLNLERIIFHPQNRLWNLKRMRLLLEWFDHPEKSFFPVLIAGTKGKGSTGFFLESILKASAIPAGFYSSPHLEDPRERIRLQGRMISRRTWIEGLRRVRNVLKTHRLQKSIGDFTYFEIMTLLAILAFKQAKVRIGIFEVGMGGRLDATNTIHAPLVILTPVYLDHEAFLGDTIAKIADEKAAIIHGGADVVVSPQKKAARDVIRRRIRSKKATAWTAASIPNIPLGLLGDFQRINAGAAVQAARILKDRYGYPMADEKVILGLTCDHWPGRLEYFKGRPDIVIDGAHNPSSIQALVGSLRKLFAHRRQILIFGASRDKRTDKMLQILGTFFEEIVLTPIPTPRSQEMEVLLREARPHFKRIYPQRNVAEALEFGRRMAGRNDLMVVTGSFYLIGEVRKLIK